jgi:DNA-binding NarL/FixJ family response regulator
LRVSIRAADPLVRDLLEHVCVSANIDIRGETADVAVLADPTPDDWRDARRDDRPIVLVAVQPLDTGAIAGAIANGASGVVHSDSDPLELPRAVAVTAKGGAYLDARLTAELLRVVRGERGVDAIPRLTPREVQILESIERGESVKQTARGLGVAPKTVENLQSRLFAKLHVRNRAQAIRRAYALGLLAA